MSALSPGTVIAGDFRILRPLSAGGMGAVYVAHQISTNRERALKVMLGELAGHEDLKARFVQEATIGSQIDSDHAVEVVAAGIDPATRAPWLAMELLEGEDLEQHLARIGALAPTMVLELFDQLSHALGAAHAKGIVHRDLKPANVFLARSRRAHTAFMVKVLDFGIAKLLGAAKTSATAAIGTPLWMAPEQTQPSFAIAPAADVWAMGLIAFRALTGRVFWRTASDPNASSMMVLREVAFEPIAAASHRAMELGGAPVPPGFDAWFARCVNRDPGGRFPEAISMQAELRAILGAAPRPMAPAPVPDPNAYASTAWQPGTPAHSAPIMQAPMMQAPMMQAPMTQAPMMHSSAVGAASAPSYASAPMASFVTGPPVVQQHPGESSYGVRMPPPPPARRKKSSAGLYAGLGLTIAALAIGAIVLAVSASSESESSASLRKTAVSPPAQPVAPQPVAQQPVAQQPVAQQPVAQQPFARQPPAPQQQQPPRQQRPAPQPVEPQEPEPQSGEGQP